MSDEAESDTPDEESADEAGNDESKTVTGQVKAWTTTAAFIPLIVIAPLVSVLPASWRLYHKLHKWTGWQMQKASSADTLANVRRANGHEDVLPAAWAEGAEDEKDRTGWKVKGLGDKRYDSAVHGRTTSRMGKANIIHINEDSTEQGTWTEAVIDNAIQLDRERYLFRDATIEMVLSGGAAGNADQTAVADGGAAVQNVSIQKPGILHDTLVPIASPNGYDGQVISLNQYDNLKEEQSDQETIRTAKNSAWAAAKLDDIEGADLFKWVLILGAIGFVLLFHSSIAAFIAGLTGGGGGVGGAVSGIGMMHPAGLLGGV